MQCEPALQPRDSREGRSVATGLLLLTVISADDGYATAAVSF